MYTLSWSLSTSNTKHTSRNCITINVYRLPRILPTSKKSIHIEKIFISKNFSNIRYIYPHSIQQIQHQYPRNFSTLKTYLHPSILVTSVMYIHIGYCTKIQKSVSTSKKHTYIQEVYSHPRSVLTFKKCTHKNKKDTATEAEKFKQMKIMMTSKINISSVLGIHK